MKRARFALPGLFAIAGVSMGCMLWQAREQQQRLDTLALLNGRVSTQGEESGPLVVVLFELPSVDLADARIVDHFVAPRAGSFFFVVKPGRYALGAFWDRNRDLRYDPSEPAAPPRERILDLASGERRADEDIRIELDGRAPVEGPVDLRALEARTAEDQVIASLGQLTHRGEVVPLSDSRFERRWAEAGLWRPVDFLLEAGLGVYFEAPYDPNRIPVLYVHGIAGTPRDFTALIESLDRNRFQAWYYFYPSGAHLGASGDVLAQTVTQLQSELGFEKLCVVAHSMGGLVSRYFLLERYEASGRPLVQTFVTISTPWAGQAAAGFGVEHSPVVLRSWLDVAPGSEFLQALFWQKVDGEAVPRRLPEHLPHHLLFGYHREESHFGSSGDGIVTVASELRPEAQIEATSIRGVDATHVGILEDPETLASVAHYLARVAE